MPLFVLPIFVSAIFLLGFAERTLAELPAGVLNQDNLVAWCIVPFDSKQRDPEQRALMLKELGIQRCAYDWREQHVASFEQEILAYKKHGIEFFAFWSVHDAALELFKKYDLHPQIWQMISEPAGADQDDRVEAAAQSLLALAIRTKDMRCKLGLYNHGGWGGEPENLVAVCDRLHELGHEHVGIVYNFHHGHGHINDWAQSLAIMKPYLHCLNLNGMNVDEQPKLLGIGKGTHELGMIRELLESGYSGPIGVLDHRELLDARDSLKENIDGVRWVRNELTVPGSGGAKPPTPVPTAVSETSPVKPTAAVGRIFPGADDYRRSPITVQCVASLTQRESYNILVASESKKSPDHWELFSMAGSGHLTAYLPGCLPDHIRGDVDICDGQPHSLAMTLENDRVRLYVDGRSVADQSVVRNKTDDTTPSLIAGPIGIGRLVEGGIGCDGEIAWVKISRTARPISDLAARQVVRDPLTIGLWVLDGSDVSVEDGLRSVPVTRSNATPPNIVEQPYDTNRVESIVKSASDHGDAVRGARVFADAKYACLSCHRVGELGGTIGPELSAIAKQYDAKQLVESVLWPNREIKPEYVVWRVVTSNGNVVTGYKQESNDDSLSIRDSSSGKLTKIARDDLEVEFASGTVMPSGLTDAMSSQQLHDLIRFLDQCGRDEKPLAPEIALAIEMTVKLDQSRDATSSHSHALAEFPLTREPIAPEQWPNHDHPINRDRIYDFYTKQAEYFKKPQPPPMLLSQFPGLDGGTLGHWGNQNESTWSDDRWNNTLLGSVQAGVLHADGLTVVRGICLELGEKGELSACFDPDTLTYQAVWNGGFISFSPVRHGFLSGLEMRGNSVLYDKPATPNLPTKYHGFYRHGKRVVFSYRIGEVDYLDAPWVIDGRFVHQVAPADEHPLRSLITGGRSQWPQIIQTQIISGQQRPYAIDTIELPIQNPWKALLFCGDHDFLPDGSAMVCTMQGDVWRVSGLDSPTDQPGTASWRRFASGLHQPLGLVVSEGQVYVQCRDQLMRLTDLNADGEADFYECISKAFETSPAGHDFICGLQRDREGNFYTASGNQGLVRITPDGSRADVVATGFRNPDGLGILPDGTFTVPCSEGEWTPASMIAAVRPNSAATSLARDATAEQSAVSDVSDQPQTPHFGYRGPIGGQPPELPLVYLPRGLDHSSGGQVYVDSDRFGPLHGNLAHFSFGAGAWAVVLVDEVDGQLQGAVVPMAGDFDSGVHRGRFSPRDGQLYVTGMSGWGSYTPQDGCFQRIRYTGDTVQVPTAFHLHENGVRITFAQTINPAVAQQTTNQFAQVWNYRYSGSYGSQEFSSTHPGVVGHDPLTIKSSHVLGDGKSMFLELPSLQPVNQLHLRLSVNHDNEYSDSCSPTGSGHDMLITVHKLDAPFVDFPGYVADPGKTIAAHPLLTDLAPTSVPPPNPWNEPIPGARKIIIETGKNLTYTTPEFAVRVNEPIEFTLSNPDVVPHNWVLVRRGTLENVGKLSNQLIADPTAFARQYIPESDAVLVHTDIVDPSMSATVYFHAPSTPGRYPFLCSFPGHWMVMNGTMTVSE